ncbi:uncharacterized protein LOC141910513 [Tubulanus polymorphus]|uniref:uncharacterized protein LOC141910513 n=1 Tax=Tubulanus polymorphus TaxID=672921 RepID=UPI003DA43DDD
MEEELAGKLKKLRRARGVKKGIFTRQCQKAEDLIAITATRKDLKAVLLQIGQYVDAIDEINEELVALLVDDADVQDADDYMAEVYRKHRVAVEKITTAVLEARTPTPTDVETVDELPSEDLRHQTSPPRVTHMPYLSMPRPIPAPSRLPQMSTYTDSYQPRWPPAPTTPPRRTPSPRPEPLPPTPFQPAAPRPRSSTFAKSVPKLKLPVFRGDSADWPRWFGLFCSIIHRQDSLADDEKMAHLQNSVEGPPQKLIAGMLYDGRLYHHALEALMNRYGKEDDVVHACFRVVFDHPQLKAHDATALESYQGAVHSAVTTLQTLGFHGDLASAENLRRAVQKLPLDLKRDWGKQVLELENRAQRSTLLDFSEWLALQLRILLSYADVAKPDDRSSRGPKSTPFKSVNNTEVDVSSLATGSSSSQFSQSKPEVCPSCKGDHVLTNCPVFTSLLPDDRAKFAASNGRCFSCLRWGHRSRQCRSKKVCTSAGCSERHHPLLHGSSRIYPRRPSSEGSSQPSTGTVPQPVADKKPQEDPPKKLVYTLARKPAVSDEVLLQVVPLRLHGDDGKFVDTFAVLDPGSQTSLCSQEIVDQLGLDGEDKMLRLNTVEGQGCQRAVKLVKLDVAPLASGSTQKLINVDEVWSVPALKIPVAHTRLKPKQSWSHLDDIEVSSPDISDVQVLLGANVTEAIVQHESRVGKPNQPIAVRTDFGWALTGRTCNFLSPAGSSPSVYLFKKSNEENDELTALVREWWSTESFGVKYSKMEVQSLEDTRAQKMLEDNTHLVDGHYVTKLLWQRSDVKLPDNKPCALNRLRSVEKMLKNDAKKTDAYSKTFQTYLEKGYARKLTAKEADVPSPKRWFLPHHAVCNPKKKKLRVVFDAASSYQGVSLNNQLMSGPDFLQRLPGILLRFRQEPVAVMGDIEAMYHQVKIAEEDQPALSFLWRDLEDREPDAYQMVVNIFGARCSAAIACFALRKTADEPGVAADVRDAILRDFYMDDFLHSETTPPEATRMVQDVTRAVRHGGFRLTKLLSNSREVIQALPPGELSVDVATDRLPSERALGVWWNAETDEIGIKLPSLELKRFSRRELLRLISSIFDPFGMIAPVIIRAKIQMQATWSRKLHWDAELPEEDVVQWRELLQDLPKLSEVTIPRCFKPTDVEPVRRELHLFCDASEKAFGAVAYFRMMMPDGTTRCCFVMSKTRVAPLKKMSIVRLELQAAVLAVRLGESIKKEVTCHIDETLYWSDSKVVLSYVSNESKRFHMFVAVRVAEIHDSTIPKQWRHVPGSQNPADDCSRGIPAAALAERWFQAPVFLYQSEDSWPDVSLPIVNLDTNDPEIRRSVNVTARTKANHVLDPSRFSSWTRYRRVVACVLRFIRNAGSQIKKSSCRIGPLTATEMDAARFLVIKSAQEDGFPEEYSAIKAQKKIARSSKLLQLCPTIDEDGILRARGRLKNADVDVAVKFPMILPRSHDVTRLIVTAIHVLLMHEGPEHTLNEVRQEYYVPRARSTVKKIVRQCMKCKLRRVQPEVPLMSDLPAARFNTSFPFSCIGIDYFGPFDVRRFRKTEKRYGLLVTCLSTRAVHIEVSHSLDTDSFLMSFRRFIARRGRPATVYSDNGTNLKSGERELRHSLDALNQQRINDEMSQRQIQWFYNPPTASHMGGVWERLVSSVKKCLKVVIGNLTPTDEVLHTVLVEVEAVLNSRPLTYTDANDICPSALTPCHFLLGRSSPNLSPVISDVAVSHQRRWKQAQTLADHFWQRWRKEYVPTLIRRSKWTRQTRNLEIGDVVLVVDDRCPRSYWKLGRIVDVFPGADGVVRSAEVKLSTGLLRRPVSKLCVLEKSDI